MDAGAENPTRYDLKKLLALADNHNFSMIRAKSDSETAENSLTVAQSNLLPSLSFTSNVQRQFAEGSGSSSSLPWTSESSIAIKQTLFKNGSYWRALQSSRSDFKSAQIGERQAREEFSLALIQAYSKVSLLAQKFKARERKEKLLTLQYGLVKRLYTQGLKTRQDYHRLEAEMERSRIERDRIEAESKSSLRELETLLGDSQLKLAMNELDLATGDSILRKTDWDIAEADKPKENLDLEILDQQVARSKIALAEAQLALWPQVDLTASAAYGSSSFVGSNAANWQANDYSSFSVGLSLSWTIWDWGAKSALRSKARSASFLAEKGYAQKNLEISNDVQTLRESLGRLKNLLSVEKKIRDLEKTNFSEIERDYREGKANYLDLITALDRDINSEISYEEQAFEYFKTIAELKKISGELYASILAF